MHVCVTWPSLGAILDPAGSRSGPRIRDFGNHAGKLTKKGCPNTWPEKTLKFDWNPVTKWQGLGSKNNHLALYMLQNINFRGVMTYWENWCQKGFQKQATPELKMFRDNVVEDFERFMGSRNLEDLLPQIKTNRKLVARWSSRSYFGDWPGRVCGSGWGFGT